MHKAKQLSEARHSLQACALTMSKPCGEAEGFGGGGGGRREVRSSVRLVWHRLYNYDPGLVLTSLVARAEFAAADVFLSFVVVVVAVAAGGGGGGGLLRDGRPGVETCQNNMERKATSFCFGGIVLHNYNTDKL